jgi:hypothetical protein
MTVSSSTNRVSYAGNGSTTVFPYTYKIFDEDDLTVILRAADGTETTKTITSEYTVSGVGNASGGNVTMLTAPASGQTLVILREQDLVQELDIVPNDPFPADSLEAALDKLTFMVQQHEETLDRTIKASRTNTITGSEFTISAANRANKIFAFDSAGDVSIAQELGTYRGNWSAATAFAERDIVKDTSNENIYICLTAHTSSGSQPISSNADVAKWALLVDAASATASAAAAASSATDAETAQAAAEAAQAAAELAETNAETAETNAETAQTAAEAAQAAAELVYDNFDDRYLGAKASDPALDNDGSALIDGALYFDTTNNVMKVYDLGTTTWLRTTPTSGDQANINAVTANATNINAVAANATNINTVAGIDANVTTVAGISANVTTVAGISANVTTVAGISADVVTVADSAANISTVATDIANVNLVGGSITNVNTVATNLASVNSFANTYRIAASDPGDSLDEGDLVFNTTDNKMKVYNGSAWQDVAPVATSITVSQISDLTADAAELNRNDITTLGTSEASKVVTADANGVVIFDAGVVEDETAVTSSSNATTVNCRDGNVFTHVLTENTTFTFSNPPASGRAFAFTLKIVQDSGANGYTVTWPASVDWPSATAPTLTATASAVDVFVFYTHDGGTTFYGFVAGQALG